MNQRQTDFVHHFVILGNATQAAKEAGYSESSAHVQGIRLLRNDSVMQAIDAKRQSIMEKQAITEERIAEELASLAFAPLSDEIKASDKTAALNSLAKWRGMFDGKTDDGSKGRKLLARLAQLNRSYIDGTTEVERSIEIQE